MTIQPLDVVRLTVKCSQFGEDMQNVFYVKSFGSQGIADALFLANAITWLDGAYDNIDQLQGDNITYDSIAAFNVTQDSPIGEDTWDTLTVGGDTTNQEYPRQACGLVRFPTATPRSQGRKFIGGFTELNYESGGQLASALAAALAAFAADILDGFVSDGQVIEVGNWNETLQRWASWLSAIVNFTNAIQRRRALGVGS